MSPGGRRGTLIAVKPIDTLRFEWAMWAGLRIGPIRSAPLGPAIRQRSESTSTASMMRCSRQPDVCRIGASTSTALCTRSSTRAVKQSLRQGKIVNLPSVQGFSIRCRVLCGQQGRGSVVDEVRPACAWYRAHSRSRVAPDPIDASMLRSRARNAWPPAMCGVTPLARLGYVVEIANGIR